MPSARPARPGARRRVGVLSGLRAWLLSGLVVGLAACSGAAAPAGSAASPSGTASAAPGGCGTFSLAVGPQGVRRAASAVLLEVAERELGCTVVTRRLKEEIAWQGFASGQVDVLLESRAQPDLRSKYLDQQRVAVDLGPIGTERRAGWWVPSWMAEEYPGITDHRNLNRYARLFRTPRSGDAGQLLEGDPSVVTHDKALVDNLGLDLTVVYAGSDGSVMEAFRTADRERTPLLAHLAGPGWFVEELGLAQVRLPPHTPGCDAVATRVTCGYPTEELHKIAGRRLLDSGSTAVRLVRTFRWTEQDAAEVDRAILEDGLEPRQAARAWTARNPDLVAQWLTGTGAGG